MFAGATSYWLVLAKSGGSAAGAAGGTCCPGGDGGAASWAAFLGSGDLALAARAVRRHRGCGRSRCSAADGKICAPCMIRGACAAKSAPSWQDLRAVYSQTAVCGAFRMHGAHILPKPAHFGCMACESCQELAIFPPEAAFGMHGAQNLPRIAARERTAAESCHGKTPGNAPRENIAAVSQAKGASGRNPAIGECSGTHSVDILPSADIRECAVSAYLHCQSPGCAAFSTRGNGFSPLAVLWGSARNTFCAREWTFRLLGA